MMRRLPLASFLVVVLLWTSTVTPTVTPAVAAQNPKPETIRRGKQATALVVLGTGRGFASAFCIDPSGYFVTNHHVVDKKGGSKKIQLVLNSAEADEKKFEAEVVRLDKDSDLALLRVKGNETHKFIALEIGEVDGLIETQQLVAFGYPFGTALAVAEKKYPSISVNVGRITALRKAKGKLQRIQLDAQLNPGNSGGPVLNAAGKVVGIVRSGVLGAGVNFAIPVSQMEEFLGRPELTVASLKVLYENRHDPLELTVRVMRFSKSRPKLDVEVTVGRSEPVAPFVVARLEGAEIYRVRIVPVPRSAAGGLIPISLRFSDGSVRCKTPDVDVTLDGKKYRLSKISHIERNKQAGVIVLRNGQRLTGKRLEVGKLRAEFGGFAAPLDADQASTITVLGLEPESKTVAFHVVAKQEGKVVAAVSGVISIKRSPAETAIAEATPAARLPSSTYKPPKLKTSRVEIPLREPFASVRTGGGGRYLIFHLKKAQKLAVFDVSVLRVVYEISIPADKVLYAAGRDKLMVVLPGGRIVQRWSLTDFQREKTVAVPNSFDVRKIVMGSNSQGPLLLFSKTNGILFDIDRMKQIKVEGGMLTGHRKWGLNISVSADGRTMMGWIDSGSGATHSMMRIDGNRTTLSRGQGGLYGDHWVQPNSDNSLVLTNGGALYTPDLKRISADWLSGHNLHPTEDPRLFIATRGTGNKSEILICTSADRRVIYTHKGLSEMPGLKAIAGEPRVRYLSNAHALLTLPDTNDRIVARKLDLMQALEASEQKYLFVLSFPRAAAVPGMRYRYPLEVKSKLGGLSYTLESGPEGMMISDEGVVQWNVPVNMAGKSVPVIITVKDRDGRETFHSFDLKVSKRTIIRPAQAESNN